MSRCNAEMCPMWDGEGCPCDMFGLDRNDLPSNGVFTVVVQGMSEQDRAECTRRRSGRIVQ
jgi:hypothetical protein